MTLVDGERPRSMANSLTIWLQTALTVPKRAPSNWAAASALPCSNSLARARSTSSSAALMVNVVARICSGVRTRTSSAMSLTILVVFPAPAAAVMVVSRDIKQAPRRRDRGRANCRSGRVLSLHQSQAQQVADHLYRGNRPQSESPSW